MPTTVSSAPGIVAILDALGMSITQHPTSIATPCPFCGGVLTAALDALLCNSPHCPWLVGDALDLVSAVKGSPGEALAWMLREFPERYAHIPKINRATWVAHTLHSRRTQRGLIEFLVQQGGPSASLPLDASVLGSRLGAKGWAVDTVQLTTFFISARDMGQFRQLVEAANPALARLPNDWSREAAMVTPYGPSPEIISALHVNWPRIKRESLFWLDPYLLQYAGLWQRQLGDRPVLVTSLEELYQLSTDTAIRRPDLRPLAWLPRNDQAATVPHRLHQPVLAVGPEQPPLRWQQALQQHAQLRFAHLEDISQGSPVIRTFNWASLVAYYACTQAAQGLSIVAQTHLRSLTLTTTERHFVRKALQDEGYLEALAVFDNLTAERVITFTERGSIVETQSGYELRENGRPVEILCNFTMAPRASVVFGQDSRLSYEFELSFAEQTHMVLVSRNALDNPQQVEEQVQSSALRADGRRVDQIPMILSKNHFRHVTRHWREHLARCPVKQGIELLGWSTDRKKFWTARGYVDIDGMHEFPQMQWHPEVAVFKCYTAERSPLAAPHQGALPPVLQDIWRYAAAGLVRSYHNRVHNALALEQNPWTQALLERLFAGLDQVRGLPAAVLFNTSDALCGFPAFGFSHYDSVATRTPGNLFLLSPTGARVPEDPTLLDADWDAIAARFHQDLLRVALWLFGQMECAYVSPPHVVALSGVLAEGNWVLQQVDGAEAWPESAYPYQELETYLATLASDVPAHVRLQAGGRNMQLRLDPQLHRDAFLQLQALTMPAVLKVVDNEWVEGENTHLSPVLRQYFTRLDNLPSYS